MTMFNFINVALYDQAAVARARANGPLSDEALAIAMAWPSVDHKGIIAKSGATKRPSRQAFEAALHTAWHDDANLLLGVTKAYLHAVVDNNGMPGGGYDGKSNPSKPGGNIDRMVNNLRGLRQLGYVKLYANGVEATGQLSGAVAATLTDEGVAYIKRVAPALGKAAGEFSSKAYDKALAAAAKAAKAAAKAAKAPKPTVDATAETETSAEVEVDAVNMQPPVADADTSVEISN